MALGLTWILLTPISLGVERLLCSASSVMTLWPALWNGQASRESNSPPTDSTPIASQSRGYPHLDRRAPRSDPVLG